MSRQNSSPGTTLADETVVRESVPADQVREQLRRILLSPLFARSVRLSRFLTYIVKQTLEGQQDTLKEYQVGVEVCDRRESYDPRTDPVVRVEARRLRAALQSYYTSEGAGDKIVIALPKGGYAPRFSCLAAPPAAAAPEVPPQPQPVRLKRHWLWTALVASLIALLACVILLWREHSRPPLAERDTVILADFTNSTGDTVFDETLRQGLAVQLEQSPYLHLVSESQVAQAMALMGQPRDARVTATLARQICERTGSVASIEGSISALGGQYVLNLQSVNCHTGDILAKAQETAASKERVLSMLGAAASTIRHQLGESLASVQRFDAPPENVTTPSLEALHAYSLGFKVHVVSLDEAQAAMLFQRAVTLDPGFAMAYARLATCYANLGEFSRAEDSMRKAYALRERVSEREQLFILSMYHELVTGDLEAARETYEMRAQLYPKDDIPIGNLGNVYFALGMYDRARAVTEEAVRRNPGSRIWQGNLVSIYIASNQLSKAVTTLDDARAHQLDSNWLHLCLYLIEFVQHDPSAMEREAAFLRDDPSFADVLLYYQSQAASYEGRWSESRNFTRRTLEAARRDGHTESEAFYVAEAAAREALVGNSVQAQVQARAALAEAHGRDTKAVAALALAMSGNATEAGQVAQELERLYPRDTLLRSNYLPMIRAAALLRHGASPEQARNAIAMLAPALSYEAGSQTMMRVGFLTCYPAYLRGQAYLAAREGPPAAAEFEKILANRQLTLTDPVGALAYLGLARAKSLQGDRAGSRASYEVFLNRWKNADHDIPITKEAATEYARLR